MKNYSTFNLTYPQKSITDVDKVYPDTGISNILVATRFDSTSLDLKLLEKAINLTYEKYDVTRLSINTDTECQYITEYNWADIPIDDFSCFSEQERNQYFNAFAKTPIISKDNGLIEFRIQRYPLNKIGICIKAHHAVSDAWSIALLFSSILSFYTQLCNNQDISIEHYSCYEDFAKSHIKYLNSNKHERDQEYWENKFSEYIEPISQLEPTQLLNIQASRKAFKLSIDEAKKINQFCDTQNISAYNLFITTFSIYLCKRYDTKKCVIGTPILNRNGAKEKKIAGMFVNMCAFISRYEGELSFYKLLDQNKEELFTLMKHGKYPIQKLIDMYRKFHNTADRLINVCLSYQNAKYEKPAEDMTYSREWIFNGCSMNTLTMNIIEGSEDIPYEFAIEYRTDLFSDDEIEGLYHQFKHLLFLGIEMPEISLKDMPLITNAERHKILYDFNNTAEAYPDSTPIQQLFEKQVAKTPNAICLIYNNKTMTYKILNERSNQLGRKLRTLGVVPNQPVAMIVKRSIEMIIGIMGVIKAGGAYVPIDASYPWNRIEYMLNDCNSNIILTTKDIDIFPSNKNNVYIDLDNHKIYDGDFSNLKLVNKSTDLAYIIYTSGSTGQPKGVMIEHKSLINHLDINGTNGRYTLGAQDTCLMHTTMAFDVSIDDIFLPIVFGAKMVISHCENTDIDTLVDLIVDKAITFSFIMPNMLPLILNKLETMKDKVRLKTILTGVESIDANLLNRCLMLNDGLVINNGYGPTEATVYAIAYPISHKLKSGRVPIGKPIQNTRVVIIDQEGELCPIGKDGELCILGDSLARGYLNRPDLTKEKFVSCKFYNGERMYKTGDIAKWLPDGNIMYVNRNDNQVKVRGFRIELGEIESIVSNIAGICMSIALYDKQSTNIYLYYTSDSISTDTDIKDAILEKLPSYMVPSSINKISKFPKLPNGKIDRKALPIPDFSKCLTDYVPPKNDEEKIIVQIFESILGTSPISVNDDFFEIGGNSIKAMESIDAIQKQGYAISVNTFMKQKKVGLIASALKKESTNSNILKLNNVTSKDKLFLIHGGDGGITPYLNLSNHMLDKEVYGISFDKQQFPFPQAISNEVIATDYISKIKSVQATGKYTLLGWSIGGTIAFEIAKQLEENGEEVNSLILLDSIAPRQWSETISFDIDSEREFINKYFPAHYKSIETLESTDKLWRYIYSDDFTIDKVQLKKSIPYETLLAIPDFDSISKKEVLQRINTLRMLHWLRANYLPPSINTNILFINPTEDKIVPDRNENIETWRQFAKVEVINVKSTHYTMLDDSIEDIVLGISNFLGSYNALD